MGSPTLATFNLLCRTGTDRPIPDEQLVRLEKSGLWVRVVDHPDYAALAADLAEKKGEPVIRRARSLDLETCGARLDVPFSGAQLWSDVYGEGDGSFDLTKVEPLHLDTSLLLGPALEAILPRRQKISMGARRRRWFVKNANSGKLPADQQAIVDKWRKEKKFIFFPDSEWRNAAGFVYAEYAYGNGERWGDNYVWLDRRVDE